MLPLPPALVLAAGLGVRLQPLTSLRAKPAMPLGGEPLIAHILHWLRRAGMTEAIVNLHHRPETITAVVGEGSAFGLRVRYSWESPLLGSGGGPRRAFSLVPGDELLIVNGDTLTDVDLATLVERHRQSEALVTMALIDNPQPERYGGVTVENGSVTGFTGRGRGGLHFVGVQVARREAFAAAIDGAAQRKRARDLPRADSPAPRRGRRLDDRSIVFGCRNAMDVPPDGSPCRGIVTGAAS